MLLIIFVPLLVLLATHSSTSSSPLLFDAFRTLLSLPLTNLSSSPFVDSLQLNIRLNDSSCSLFPSSTDLVAFTLVLPENETLVDWYLESQFNSPCRLSIWLDFPSYIVSADFLTFTPILRMYFDFDPLPSSSYSSVFNSTFLSSSGTLFYLMSNSTTTQNCLDLDSTLVSQTTFPSFFDSNVRYVQIGTPFGGFHDEEDPNGHTHWDWPLHNSPQFPRASAPLDTYTTVSVHLTSTPTGIDFYVPTMNHTHAIESNWVLAGLSQPSGFKVALCAMDNSNGGIRIGEGGIIMTAKNNSSGLMDSNYIHFVDFENRFPVLVSSDDVESIGVEYGNEGHTHAPAYWIEASMTDNPVAGSKTYCVENVTDGPLNSVGSHNSDRASSFVPTHWWDCPFDSFHTNPPHVLTRFLLQTSKEGAGVYPTTLLLGDSLPPLGWHEVTTSLNDLLLRGANDSEVLLTGTIGGEASHSHVLQTCLSNPRDEFIRCEVGNDVIPNQHQHSIFGRGEVAPNSPHSVKFRAFERLEGARLGLIESDVEIVRMRFECFGVQYVEEAACGGSAGICVAEDECKCSNGYFGEECGTHVSSVGSELSFGEFWIPFRASLALLSHWIEEGSAELVFDCSRIIEDSSDYCVEEEEDCWCRFDAFLLKIDSIVINVPSLAGRVSLSRNSGTQFSIRLPSELVGTSQSIIVDVSIPLYVPATIVSNDSLMPLSVVLAITLSTVTVFAIISIICIVGTVFCVSKAVKQQKSVSKLAMIEDFDVLLAEQSARETKYAGSLFDRLNVRKELFVIEYQDVELLSEIGRGGSSCVVYRAKWQNLEVAFKLYLVEGVCGGGSSGGGFLEEFERFLEREVSILASIRHPHCLKFFGSTISPPRIGVVLELCANGDLRQFLGINATYPLLERFRLLTEIASACCYLHRMNIIHRDLKLGNVLVTKDEETRVMDYGLSRILKGSAQGDDSAKLTTKIGTSGYMAPELLTSQGDYTNSVDVFAFGILAHQILTNDFKWYGSSAINLEFSMAFKQLRPSQQKHELFVQNERLANYIARMWSEEPDDRPSFEEIMVDLDELRDCLVMVENVVQDEEEGDGDEEEEEGLLSQAEAALFSTEEGEMALIDRYQGLLLEKCERLTKRLLDV